MTMFTFRWVKIFSPRCVPIALAGLFFSVVTVFAPTPAQAQLNENCTISILNRTAQVQPDGSWRIANVPGSFGSLRARDLRRGWGDGDR